MRRDTIQRDAMRRDTVGRGVKHSVFGSQLVARRRLIASRFTASRIIASRRTASRFTSLECRTASRREFHIVSEVQKAHLSPETVLAQLKKNAVSHVVWLPDSETNWLFVLMKAEPSLTLVGVTREGLAFSTAAGVWAGGKTPVILIQNTGLMESGDSLRGWALGINVPVVMMVGYRGWTRHGVNTDTAATYTERFLNAFGINYYLIEDDSDAPRISIAFEEAKKTKRPVAVLVADEYHGFNR
jgi:sulfopyruvate decarboxylase subunit alpha